MGIPLTVTGKPFELGPPCLGACDIGNRVGASLKGYGLAAFRVAGALGFSFRFQQRDEGVPRRPGGPPYLGFCRSNYLSQAHTQLPQK